MLKKKLTGACLCCKNTTEQEGPKAQRCQIKGENSVVFQWHEQGCSSNYFFNFLKTGVTFQIATKLISETFHLSTSSYCQKFRSIGNTSNSAQRLLGGKTRDIFFLQIRRLDISAGLIVVLIKSSEREREGCQVNVVNVFNLALSNIKFFLGARSLRWVLVFCRADAGFVVWHFASWSAHHRASQLF